ncbi:MAG: hypothetical protein LBC75_11245 [Fibromonadaceae bacterium]|nr:hypothetical protein [Fibromonadaceae bacterium]
MRKSISKLTLAATFGLALTLTFSCSSDNDDDDENNVPSYYHPDNPNNRCNRGVVEAKCGDVWYNISKYVCINGNTITQEQYLEQYLEQYYEQNGYVRCR